MGLFLSKAFIPPDDLLGCMVNMTGVEEGEEGVVVCTPPFHDADWVWGFMQVLTLMAIYGYVLFYASNMLSQGSELLLLVPSLAGLVGSVVLPILGAVPDGAIMLFSGLGANAQEQLTVGIGALAGSTIMLLTVPWGLSIYLGSVPVEGASGAQYRKKQSKRGASCGKVLTGFGVTPEPSIQANAKIMLGTALIYLVIQGPAFSYATEPSSAEVMGQLAAVEHPYALAGLVLALLSFVGYIWAMTQQDDGAGSNKEYMINAASIKAIENTSNITLAGIIAPIITQSVSKASEEGGLAYLSGALLDAPGKRRLQDLLKPFFKKFDVNGDGQINTAELRDLLRQLGEEVDAEEAQRWMLRLDPDHSGSITTDQFADAMLNYVSEKAHARVFPSMVARRTPSGHLDVNASDGVDGVAEEDEEDDEMPEDLVSLSPEQQQAMIKQRAALMMIIGLGLILIFSDPMVDVMSNVGARLGVPPFYVSFILAPLASNASELIASLNYASKKTRKTITVSLAALEGAACMNNTFCLAIFMGLIYFKGLAWKFSAETIAILIVQCLITVLAMQTTQKVWHALLALTLFPLSLIFVAWLEAIGLD